MLQLSTDVIVKYCGANLNCWGYCDIWHSHSSKNKQKQSHVDLCYICYSSTQKEKRLQFYYDFHYFICLFIS